MRAGRLRHRVNLQSLVETSDAYGQRIQSWADLGTYWAYIGSLSGRELMNAAQVKPDVTHSIQMRYIGSAQLSRGLLPSMRLIFETRIFNLLWVNNVDERNRVYELLAQEIPVVPI